MLTIILKDWTGREVSRTKMIESDLGYTGDIEHLQRFAQRVSDKTTGCCTVEQDGNIIATANYLNSLC